jgi:hypothetical protein
MEALYHLHNWLMYNTCDYCCTHARLVQWTTPSTFLHSNSHIPTLAYTLVLSCWNKKMQQWHVQLQESLATSHGVSFSVNLAQWGQLGHMMNLVYEVSDLVGHLEGQTQILC